MNDESKTKRRPTEGQPVGTRAEESTAQRPCECQLKYYCVLAEAVPSPVFIKDLDGRYVYVNESAARFLGKANF